MRLSKRLGAAVAVTAAVFAMASPASASSLQAPEAAAVCGVTPTNRDYRPYEQFFKQDVNLRNGPAWECKILNTAGVTSKADYWCSADGFTYLRTESTKQGWVANIYLRGGGSTIPC
ncbi:hypothetical protein [Streptomyces sp. NPDC018000]|uniref:hypothetical protein n=1 Tax=Streptomyces sp. NPDC018000 TaxID=3365028 RepID=UPI003796422C